MDVSVSNTRLLEQIKRKREEHSALTQAEQQNLQLAREQHRVKIGNDEKRLKAAWDEVNAAKAQCEINKSDLDNRSRELAVWQRKNDLKEQELKDIETSLANQSSEVQANIKRTQNEMGERVKKLRVDLTKTLDMLEKLESQVLDFSRL